MCSKRIFSNDDLGVDYKYYNKIKNGCEILKTVKLEDNKSVLNKFNNYNTWQTLNSAYFKYINNTKTIQFVKNIYSSDESFIDKNDNYQMSICQYDKQYLYPYGNIVNKKEISPSYSTNIYICKWCNKDLHTNVEYKNKYDETLINDNKTEYKECRDCNNKYNKCENRKPLFI
jgi:hypothetical protein